MTSTEVTAFIGPPFSGKTEALIEKLSTLNPFDYIFIGSQGEFVKTAADFAISRMGAINRSAFKTVDQIAVEMVKSQTSKMYAKKALKLSILSSVIDGMSTDSLNIPEELRLEANAIKRNSTVEKLLSFIDDVKAYMRMDEFEDAETLRDQFIAEVIKRFKDEFNKKKLFDTYDAYEMGANGDVNIEGEYLFIDGFYDFPPIYTKFFKKLISSFKKVYITVTTGALFKDSKTILNVVNSFDNKKVYMKFHGDNIAQGLFVGHGKGVKVYKFEKRTDEVEWVARKIKKMIVKGESPSNMEIVVKSDSSDYIKDFERKFDGYGISTTYLGTHHLVDNTFVQQLLLPLRVITAGYPTDMLMSIVLARLVGEYGEFALIYDMAHLNRGYIRLSRKSRLNDWLKRIENFEEYLRKKRKLLNQEREDLVFRSEVDEITRFEKIAKEARKTVKRLFDFLKNFEDAKTPSEYTSAFENVINILRSSDSISENDERAIEKFNELIWSIEDILNFMNIVDLRPEDYRYYLELQIKDEKYTPVQTSDVVKISDLLTSRFSHVPYKFFVGFVDGEYPAFHVNHFYNAIEESKMFGIDRMTKRMRDDKLDFYVALSHAQKAYLTMPEATAEGVPIIPSIYTEEIFERFSTEAERPSFILPMSRQEAIVEYAKSIRWGKRDEDVEKRLGLKINQKREYKLKSKENVEFCEMLAEKPVSFYKFHTFEKCPLRFFFSYVLNVPQRVVYDLDLNAMEAGIVYHNALRRLLIEEYSREKLANYKDNELKTKIEEITRQELAKVSFFEDEIFRINVLKISDVLYNYMKSVELSTDIGKRKRNLWAYRFYSVSDDEVETFKPALAEVSFGLGKKGYDVVEIDGVKFIGRIDRVDRCSYGVMIVDYKSGNSGEKDQLALYSKMYKRIFDEPVLKACFSVIRDARISNLIKDDKELSKIGDDFMVKVKEFLRNLKDADFQPTKDCRMCDYSRICPARGEL